MKPRRPSSFGTRRALPWLAAALAVAAQAAAAADLRVTINGVRDGAGVLRVAVCDAQEFLRPTCGHTAQVPAQAGAAVIHGLAPGVYAVQAHHDANRDGHINRRFFGRPTEGIGFSRDAAMRGGPPEFADAAIALGPRGGGVTLTMRYWEQ